MRYIITVCLRSLLRQPFKENKNMEKKKFYVEPEMEIHSGDRDVILVSEGGNYFDGEKDIFDNGLL